MRVVVRVARDAFTPDVLERGRRMAIRTRHAAVAAEQREACQIVIEKHVPPPPVLVVTGVAVRSLVVAMARIARRLELLVVWIAEVAVIASDQCVAAAEGIVSVPIVREGMTSPCERRVASRAIASELVAMCVVASMTTIASRRNLAPELL
jgi:hypothetical protein